MKVSLLSIVRALAGATIALAAHATWADPADYVKTPLFDPHEYEFETKYGTSKLPDGQGRISAMTGGLGYGVTSFWFTEGYVKFQKGPGDRTRYESAEWENRFLLTERGKSAIDAGLMLEIEVPREREEGYELRLGPLLQTRLGQLQLNSNFLLKRTVHAGADAGAQQTELHYQLQARYPVQADLAVGVQAFGEVGKWNHWSTRSQQNHRIGPAVFGKIALGGDESIHYDIAWLAGASKAAPNSTLRMQLEFDF